MSSKKIIAIVAGIVVVALVPVVVFVGLGAVLVGMSPVASLGDRGCNVSSLAGAPTPSAAPAASPAVQLTPDSGESVSLTPVQAKNASAVISVGKQLNIPSRGIQIALMVAMQESTLRNLSNTNVPGSELIDNDGSGRDHDSVGIFQQRANWGSVQDRMDPSYSARAFFGGPAGPNGGTPKGLLDTANWQTKSLGKAAQDVQISAFPDAYDKWATTAESIMSIQGLAVTDDTSMPGVSNGGCPSQGDDAASPAGAGGEWKAPNGKTGADLIAFTEQFVGVVPYSGACGSAGSPTAGWCCTGFVYYAYSQVLGIELPSTVVSGQLAQAHQIPASEAQAGDLVAWVGHHIGIYDGAGGLVHSPDWGRKLTHAKSYQFNIGGTPPTFWRVNAIGDGAW